MAEIEQNVPLSPEVESAVREIIEENLTDYFNHINLSGK